MTTHPYGDATGEQAAPWAVIHTLTQVGAHLATHREDSGPVNVLTAEYARDACMLLGVPRDYTPWVCDVARAAIAASAEQVSAHAHPLQASAAVHRLEAVPASVRLRIITGATHWLLSGAPTLDAPSAEPALADDPTADPVRPSWPQAAALAWLGDAIT